MEVWKYRCLPYYREANEKRYLSYKQSHEELTWEEVITRVEIGLDQEFYSNVGCISCPERLTVLVDKYCQLPQDFIPGDLEMIKPEYNESTLLLRRSARILFEIMCRDAGREGLSLKAISTFRSFHYQKQVYFKNWQEDIPVAEYQAERDKVSARAGHSEHQTGLAVDINDLEETFADTPEGVWLAEHSYDYGFILRYPKGKEPITGYSYEPWHFRYIGRELAHVLHQSQLTYDEYYIRCIRDCKHARVYYNAFHCGI